MPIYVDSAEFIDAFGNNTPFYKSNTGDEVTVELNIRGSIRMSSVGNPLTLDPTTNQVTSAGQSWLDNGFRPGQFLYCVRYTSGGAVIPPVFWTQVAYVDDTLIDLGGVPTWYSIVNQEHMTLTAVVANGSTNALPFDEVNLKFNQVINQTPGSAFSLIDAEVTKALVQGIAALPIGGIAPGVILGNQSGTFLKSAEVERVVNVDQFYKWKIRLVFANQGMYDPEWFFSSDCLKAWISTQWAVVAGEPYDPIIGNYNLDADTGYYDEAFNASGLIDSTLVQGLSEVDYCVPTTADIIVDGPITDMGIGSCYLSDDITYYKNRPFSQYNLAMIIPTAPLAVGVLNSETNEFNADYTLEVNSINSVGTVTTINVTITPNANFQSFIDGRDPQDRKFQVWVRCGNVNLLVFNNQLTCDPPIGGPLPMVQDYGYLDHCQNLIADTSFGDLTGFFADTEDDVAYVGRFLLDKNQAYESFSVKMEAYNTVTGEDFTLQIASFGFGAVPISGDGRYLLNESLTTVSTLPTTSQKRDCLLQLDASLDTPTQYGVLIYCPWLLDWKYWLPQLNASVDFYPTQDKNWEQYDNLADWELRTELTLIKEGLAYTHANTIIDREYDADDNVASNIDMIVDATNVVTAIVANGTLMRIKSTHKNLVQPWDQNNIWGMITVEPFENQPRWICSSCVDSDNNSNNPLSPLSGLTIDIQFPNPTTAVLECYFNPDIIDCSNGVKVTAKIKDDKGGFPLPIEKTTSPNDGPKGTADDNILKTLAP